MERKHSPIYFAKWIFAGALLTASVYFLPSALIPRGWPRALAFGIPAFVGLAAYLWGMKRLNEEIWSEEEVAPVLALLENPFSKCATWILAFAALLPFAFHGRTAGSGMLLLPCYAAIGMRQLLAPRKRRDNGLRDWRSFKPLQSEHWGEQPQR
jgi:hypothetical protein